MKNALILLCLCFFSFAGHTQIVGQGKIIFEEKTNVKMQLQVEEMTSDWVKSMIDKIANFKVSEYSLRFNRDQSLYLFERNIEQKGMSFFGNSNDASKNKVWTQFKKGIVTSEKEAYENSYFITDTLTRYNWKIEDEMRTIAGFLCRKAITTIDDSVVVVAFYTTEIMVSGGPEGMNGLPGMILGLAVPRLYTTWFATRVEFDAQEIKGLEPHRKSKQVNRSEYIEELRKGTKNWGKYGIKILWWAML